MLIKQLSLENFRCFNRIELQFDSNFVILQGNNGAGKTSVLEALHYACYLRSFRTTHAADLLKVGAQHFFIQLGIYQPQFGLDELIRVGFAPPKNKVLTLNETKMQDYKELIKHYRAVTLTADDVALVSGAPEMRRDFLNVGLMLQDHEILNELKEHRRLVTLRNSFLEKNNYQAVPHDEFATWTELLWRSARSIQQQRITYLRQLELAVNGLLAQYFAQTDTFLSVSLQYLPKNMAHDNFEDFFRTYQATLLQSEQRFGRGLFGAHLDDFLISFDNQRARVHASRGQQKLITYLIKIIQVMQTIAQGDSAIFLIDDFLTDFDSIRARQCLELIKSLSTQIVLTVPLGFDHIFTSVANKQYIQIAK